MNEAIGEMIMLLALGDIDTDTARGVLEDLFSDGLLTRKQSKALQDLISQLE